MSAGIVILSRINSSRVSSKPLQNINDKTLIEHLVGRCLATGLPVCLAIPSTDVWQFQFLHSVFKTSKFTMFCGYDKDPMARMSAAVYMNEWDYGIRVCHDKIFIDKNILNDVLSSTIVNGAMYGVLKDPIDGTSFEVIHKSILHDAAEKYKDVEHISYAIKSLTDNIYIHENNYFPKTDHRLLIDFPNDLKMIGLVLKSCGNNCTLKDALSFLDQHYWISKINRLPRVTVYTCAYNAEKWIMKAMGSVSMQQNFNQMEYIIINDDSSDGTEQMVNKFCSVYKNSFLINNNKNIGLSSSSNKALSVARGKYIIRLDADDYFTYDRVVEDMVARIEAVEVDALYPNNYFGSFNVIQNGNESHHVGGAMFKTKAVNHVKFTEGLRGYEGLDFFSRAQSLLKIGYLGRPVFLYRQHEGSLTKNNLEERTKILEELKERYALTK